MRRKLVTLTVQQKLKIINQLKKKEKSKEEIENEYGCNRSTINRMLKQESKLKEIASKNAKIKRQRSGSNKDVEKALKIWFDQCRHQNALITGPLLLNKAKELAVKMNVDFEPTTGWLYRWQKRENIKYVKIHGEGQEACQESAQTFLEHILPQVLDNREVEDIFNADECGLFYKSLPKGTLAYKGDTLTGLKSQKKRLTVLFLCNATGTYKKIFVIGSSKNPRCFKNKNLPIPYYSNKNAWMTTEIWNQILLELDSEIKEANRKITLFADNASCHQINVELQNVEVQFLPPNTTAILQPLDQGIIKCFKSYYRQIILRKQILAIERDMTVQNFIKSINLYDVMLYIKRSWWLVESRTIMNCFRKAGFFPKVAEVTEVADLALNEDLIYSVQDSLFSNSDFRDYVRTDDDLQCWKYLTENEIVNEIANDKHPENFADDSSEDEVEISEKNTVKEVQSFKNALEALDTLKRFFDEKHIDYSQLEEVEEKMFESHRKNLNQTKLTDYFKTTQ